MRFLRFLLLILAAVTAEAQPPPTDAGARAEQYVIPPGVEPLFADMLGSGQTLPAGCRFADGQIERTAVLATYACQDGQVVLELLHPEVAPAGGVRTQRFALSVKSGTPPPGLTDAIAERIRTREGEFAWKTIGDAGSQGLRRALPIAAGLLVAALLIWAVRRFRSKRAAPEE